jgi:hypothetical protein
MEAGASDKDMVEAPKGIMKYLSSIVKNLVLRRHV